MTRARSAAPLRLLAPVSPGPAAWVYQSSLGGGFVGKDAIELEVEVGAGARLFLTSQASSKVYRRAASRCQIDVAVGEGGVVVVWPDPIVCFAGASFEQVQRLQLARSAGVITVDSWTAGRIARGERWAFERLALRTELSLDGTPVFADGIVVSPEHGELEVRLAGAQALATIVVAGEPFAPAVPRIERRVVTRPLTAQPRVSASVWPWGVVVRVAAPTTEQLTAAIHALIGDAVREALGADPFARKW